MRRFMLLVLVLAGILTSAWKIGAAEREQAQQEAAKEYTFRLSPREREIQDQLGGKQ